MNFKEAKTRKKLKEFIAEHEVKDPHPQGKERFDALLDAMTRGEKPASPKTSGAAPSGGSGGTRTRRGT